MTMQATRKVIEWPQPGAAKRFTGQGGVGWYIVDERPAPAAGPFEGEPVWSPVAGPFTTERSAQDVPEKIRMTDMIQALAQALMTESGRVNRAREVLEGVATRSGPHLSRLEEARQEACEILAHADAPGYWLSAKDDGTWLVLDGPTKKAMIRLEGAAGNTTLVEAAVAEIRGVLRGEIGPA